MEEVYRQRENIVKGMNGEIALHSVFAVGILAVFVFLAVCVLGIVTEDHFVDIEIRRRVYAARTCYFNINVMVVDVFGLTVDKSSLARSAFLLQVKSKRTGEDKSFFGTVID